jgi:pheromone shutdown protein TraB
MASEPGKEFLTAMKTAESIQARLVYIDRDIQTTLRRLWRELGFRGRTKFTFHLLGEMLSVNAVRQEHIEKLLAEGEIDNALSELSEKFPAVKTVLVDERDRYMAQKIRECGGHKVIAVVGAGHLEGIEKNLLSESDITSLSSG